MQGVIWPSLCPCTIINLILLIVECSVYILVFRTSNNFLCGRWFSLWLRHLARKIVVCSISLNLHGGGEEGVEGPKRYIDL